MFYIKEPSDVIVKFITLVYGVVLGIFRYLKHVSESPKKRAVANVKIVVDPSKGFNDGLYTLVATGSSNKHSKNIAMNSPLFCDFGPGWDPEKEYSVDGTPAKKFKGSLEALFEEQKKRPSQKKEQKRGPIRCITFPFKFFVQVACP